MRDKHDERIFNGQNIKIKKIAILAVCLFILTDAFTQKISYKLSPISEPIKVFNTVKFLIEITNTTSQPIRIFKNSFKEYGGVDKGGFLEVNGSKTKLKEWGQDTNSGYRVANFVLLAPGKKRTLIGQDITLKEAGDYTLTYHFNQDPSTINPKWGENKKAVAIAKTITKLKAEGSFTFTVLPLENKPLIVQGITWEELMKKKTVSILAEAINNPSSAFKVGIYPDRNGQVDVKNITRLGELKNMRSLTLSIGKEDIIFPAALQDIPLMEVRLSSSGGKIIFPDGFQFQPTLRWLSFNKIGKIPASIGAQPHLTSLVLTKLDMKELPNWIGELSKLEELILSNLPVKSFPTSFQKLTTLRILRVYGCEIEVLENIFNNTKLENLSIGTGKIKNINPDIKKLKNCTHLSLSYNKLTSIPKEIYQMKRLEILSIDHNMIAQLPEGIEQLKNLHSLGLMKNQLTTIPNGILDCQKMKFFNGKGNSFSKRDKTLRALKKKMKKKRYLMD